VARKELEPQVNYPLSAPSSLAGLGMGVDQAMANPVVKAGVMALALYGGAVLFGQLTKKKPRRRNPGKKRRKNPCGRRR
jgi:hypothetical protein